MAGDFHLRGAGDRSGSHHLRRRGGSRSVRSEKIHLLPLMKRTLTIFALLAFAVSGPLALTGCKSETTEIERKLGFDEFVPVYNRHITEWLSKKKTETE